eukprot:4718896-Pleurochrysis_carterae.AAC.5
MASELLTLAAKLRRSLGSCMHEEAMGAETKDFVLRCEDPPLHLESFYESYRSTWPQARCGT